MQRLQPEQKLRLYVETTHGMHGMALSVHALYVTGSEKTTLNKGRFLRVSRRRVFRELAHEHMAGRCGLATARARFFVWPAINRYG